MRLRNCFISFHCLEEEKKAPRLTDSLGQPSAMAPSTAPWFAALLPDPQIPAHTAHRAAPLPPGPKRLAQAAAQGPLKCVQRQVSGKGCGVELLDRV